MYTGTFVQRRLGEHCSCTAHCPLFLPAGLNLSPLLLRLLLLRAVLSFLGQAVDGVAFPSRLEQLAFGWRFDHPITAVIWPTNLKLLSFDGGFNQDLSRVEWPRDLKQLQLGRSFNQPIREVTFPRGLLRLDLGDNFNQVCSCHLMSFDVMGVRIGGNVCLFLRLNLGHNCNQAC